MLCEKGDFPSALQHGKRAFALAPTSEAKVEALQSIARVYRDNDLYADARGYLREALQIDDCNVGVIGDIAFCFYMEGNQGEAIRTAKRGLMLDRAMNSADEYAPIVAAAIDPLVSTPVR